MPDDVELNNLPMSSLTWMAAMIGKDEEEEFDRLLSFVEYLASFINAEAVQQVRQMRESRVGTDDESFKDLIQQISGRDAPEFQGND